MRTKDKEGVDSKEQKNEEERLKKRDWFGFFV